MRHAMRGDFADLGPVDKDTRDLLAIGAFAGAALLTVALGINAISDGANELEPAPIVIGVQNG